MPGGTLFICLLNLNHKPNPNVNPNFKAAIKGIAVTIVNWNFAHHNIHMAQHGDTTIECGRSGMICFSGVGLDSCYKAKGVCVESGCQANVAKYMKEHRIASEFKMQNKIKVARKRFSPDGLGVLHDNTDGGSR